MRLKLVCMLIVLGTASLLAQPASKPEATSLAGKPLYPIANIPDRQKLEANLAQAEKNLAANPNDSEAIIWVGRRQAYLWRYQDSIATFTKGIGVDPDNPKFYRHRGHRFITTRQFARAQ